MVAQHQQMTDLSRYHRQTLLPAFGDGGQARLAAAHAVLIGLGALGSTIAELLARAGVGALTLIDRDVVELTNLQRQTLYAESDLDTPKAEAASRRLAAINSSITLHPFAADFSASSSHRLLFHASKPTILLDGADNFDTRYLLNDLAVKHAIPYIYGGVIATRGMHMPILPSGPCLRCVFPDAPAPGTQPTCDTAGVLAPAVATVAAAQASHALRILLGNPPPPTLTSFDLWSGDHHRLEVSRDPECPCCGRRRFDYLSGALGVRAVWLCGQNSVQIFPDRSSLPTSEDDDAPEVLDLAALATRLRPHGEVVATRFMTRASLTRERGDDGGPVHLSVFPDGRALIRGLRNPDRARALYDRYIGG